MPDTVFRIAQVAVVGRTLDAAFGSLLTYLRGHDEIRVVAEFETLAGAVKEGLGEEIAADFVIVLQSYSDEFSQNDINALIGRMLFGRILCCYGPWCVADGRSHELWPVAFRIPVASSTALLELNLADFQAGEQPLFPMAAGEEVFAYRSKVFSTGKRLNFTRANVISNDAALRNAIAEILQGLGCQPTVLPLKIDTVREELDRNSDTFGLALIDLDEPRNEVEDCLELIRESSPKSRIAGLSVFAATLTGPTVRHYERDTSELPDTVLEKTELVFQLKQLLTHHLSERDTANA